MRPTRVLLTITGIVLLVIQSSARPSGESFVAATKSSKSTNSVSSSTDQSCEQTKVNGATGEITQSAAKSSSQSAASSTDSSSETYVAYKSGAPPCDDILPARNSGECDEVYYKRIFLVDECDESSKTAFYVKVFKQYKGECDADYVKRIDAVFLVYKSVDCRTNVRYIRYLEKYYAIKYAKKSGETDEAYFKRIITKTTETEEVYTSRVSILRKFVTSVDWSKVTVAYSSATGYTLGTAASTGRSISSSSSCGATLSDEEVIKIYTRKDKETDDTYFKRIITKTSTSITTEVHIETITLIRKHFCTLNLWYDKKYISLTKDYYTAFYTKKTSETDEEYYVRIVTKESYETEDQCARRVEVVRELCPNLSLWSDEKYYEKYTKQVYTVIYRKEDCEDETTYFERIVKRSAQETDIVYVGRVTLIQRTCSSLSLWYSENTFAIVKQWYTLRYAKKTGECDDDYIRRLTMKECWETSDEIYVRRVHLIHLVTACYTVWYEEKYYEKYTKTYYSIYYKKGDQECGDAWLIRVVTLLPGENEGIAIKRIMLINKCKTAREYWTSENFSKVECVKTFSKDYLLTLKKTFIKRACDCNDGLVTIVKRGSN